VLIGIQMINSPELMEILLRLIMEVTKQERGFYFLNWEQL